MQQTTQVIPLQVSKWTKLPLLVDVSEMEALINEFAPPFKIYNVQSVCTKNSGIYETDDFLKAYGQYIGYLKKGEVPPMGDLRALFSGVWSVSEEALYSLSVDENRHLIKPCSPVIQTQHNLIRYSNEEKVFRTQVFGSEGIYWGIQIGFPNIFLDANTAEISKTHHFPNMELFAAVQRWMRRYTVPTPFIVDGQKTNVPIRLGKSCFDWIRAHPHLKQQGIEVAGA